MVRVEVTLVLREDGTRGGGLFGLRGLYKVSPGGPAPPQIAKDRKLAPKTVIDHQRGLRGAHPAMLSRQAPPLQTPAGYLRANRPSAARPAPDLRTPKSPHGDAGYYLRPAEPRRLCVTRSPGICLCRCLQVVALRRPGSHATPQMPKIQSSLTQLEDSILSARKKTATPLHRGSRTSRLPVAV